MALCMLALVWTAIELRHRPDRQFFHSTCLKLAPFVVAHIQKDAVLLTFNPPSLLWEGQLTIPVTHNKSARVILTSLTCSQKSVTA